MFLIVVKEWIKLAWKETSWGEILCITFYLTFSDFIFKETASAVVKKSVFPKQPELGAHTHPVSTQSLCGSSSPTYIHPVDTWQFWWNSQSTSAFVASCIWWQNGLTSIACVTIGRMNSPGAQVCHQQALSFEDTPGTTATEHWITKTVILCDYIFHTPLCKWLRIRAVSYLFQNFYTFFFFGYCCSVEKI